MPDSIKIKIETATEKLDQIEKATGELLKLKTAAAGVTEIAKTGIVFGFAEDLAKKALEAIEPLHQLREAIEMGDALSDLSKRTGQSAGDLVVLQQAFKNAGIDAGATGQMLNLFQKALTGVNEEGLPTAAAFSKLGLSIGTLRDASAIEQIQAIQRAMQNLPNAADRTRAAMELFGRSGGQMLALLSESNGIEIAREQVGGLAETMQANAGKFDELSDSIGAIGIRATQLFAGMAAAVAPEMQKIADGLNSIDLTELGKAAGGVAAAFVDVAKVVTPVAIAIGVNLVGAEIAAGAATSGLSAALGRAAMAAKGFFASLGPVGWTILAASVAIEVFQKVMGDWNEELEKSSHVTAGNAEEVGYLKGAYSDVGAAADEAADAISSTKSAIEAMTAAVDAQVDSIRNLAKEQAALGDANLKLQIAKINAKEQAGEITPQEAEKERSTAKAQAAEQKFEAEQGGRKDEIAARRDAISKAQEERDRQKQRAEYAQSLVGSGQASDAATTNLAAAAERWKKARGGNPEEYKEASSNLSSWQARYNAEKKDANDVLQAKADGEAGKLEARQKAVDDAISSYNKNVPAIQQAYDTAAKTHPIEKSASEMEERTAASKKTQANADAQKSLDLDLGIAEASAKGDKAEEARLKWKKDYFAAWDRAKGAGMDDAAADKFATRGAEASKDKPEKPQDAGELARKAVGVSSMARLGMAVGESMAAQPVVNAIQKLIEKQIAAEKIDKIVKAAEDIVKKRGGYAP